MHRYVARLIELGLVVAADGGVAISPALATEQRFVDLLMLAHDSLVRLAEVLAGDIDWPTPTRAAGPALRGQLVTTALDVWLIPFEYAREPVVDWTSKIAWIAIIVANVRHITVDPVLSERYAHDPTPDALRRPIGTRDIARLTGLSYGTAYRHCQSLVTLGLIRYERGGWLLGGQQLFLDRNDGVRALLDYFQHRIGALVPFGFDPANAGASYLAGRPPYDRIDPA